MKVLVVLSGGMDSAVTLAFAADQYSPENVVALTFNYGQRHLKEMDAAKKLARHYNVPHRIFKLPLTDIGGSALTDEAIDVPEFVRDEQAMARTHIALTYVPFRNTIFTTIAVAFAEVLGCDLILTGFNYIDSGGYPDTTPNYLEALNTVIARGSRDKPKVAAPLIMMTKKQIVELGQQLGVPWELTWSCYEGDEHPCGKCNACVQREKGFKEANIKDPLVE